MLVAYSGLFNTERIGGTQLNGNGCVCHTVEQDTTVKVWIEGPDSLQVGEAGLYHMYLTGGPAEAGGYNVAGRFGTMVAIDSFSVWDFRAPNELTQAFPLVFPTKDDTLYWAFEYVPTDTAEVDTIYSCGLSIVYDSIPDEFDRWNFGAKFPVKVYKNPTGIISEGNVKPDEFYLEQNYPNPFNPTTKIRFTIPVIGTSDRVFVKLKIFDVLGNEVATLVDEYRSAGSYEVEFTSKGLSSGVYLYQLKVGDPSTGSGQSFMQTRKMIFTK